MSLWLVVSDNSLPNSQASLIQKYIMTIIKPQKNTIPSVIQCINRENKIFSVPSFQHTTNWITVYSAPTYTRWFHWTDCKLNEDIIKHIKNIVEINVGEVKFKVAFSYSLTEYFSDNNLSCLLSDVKNVHLCGSYLHSKGAYLLNIASTIDCQYNSPQELIADYLAVVLSYTAHSTMPYLESHSAAHATKNKNSLQNALCFSIFDISNNYTFMIR